jgi:two-component system chemotaxis response regulator CheB
MNTVRTIQAELESRALAIIAIGGSAGGIETLRVILRALPAAFPVPLVVVLHIGAGTKAAWSHVFADCVLPVHEVEDKLVVTPAAVYVAPPDYHLLVDGNGELVLSVDPAVQLSRPSIDVLLESVAFSFGARALGIVLSGANSDGAAGLLALRRAGGLVWVQAPESAPVPAMPRAALDAVPDAHVMTPELMAEVLNAYASK